MNKFKRSLLFIVDCLLRIPILIFVLFLGCIGCDNTFEPFHEQDEFYFSIYGFLNASADKNWVRVMPIRESIYLPDDKKIDARVTLEDLETGEIHLLNDSLFVYRDEAFAWNYWTEEEIIPGSSYQLKVERSDGKTSSVVIKIPPDFPEPKVTQPTIYSELLVEVTGVDMLIDLQLNYNFRNRVTNEHIVRSNSILHRVFPLEGGYQANDFGYTEGVPGFISLPHPDHERVPEFDTITAVSAGTWPDSLFSFPERDWERFGNQFGPSSPDEELIERLSKISNVENGLGYVGAVITRTSNMKICRDESDNQIPCFEG